MCLADDTGSWVQYIVVYTELSAQIVKLNKKKCMFDAMEDNLSIGTPFIQI